MVANNLIQYLPEWVSLSDEKAPYYQMIEQAVNNNPNDLSRAMYEAISKLVKAWVKVKPTIKENPDISKFDLDDAFKGLYD
jgi:hypothetical protein